MSMSFTEAEARLRAQVAVTEEALAMAIGVHEKLKQVTAVLVGLRGLGYDPQNMMGAAVHLANEATNTAEQVRARTHSVMDGIRRMVG